MTNGETDVSKMTVEWQTVEWHQKLNKNERIVLDFFKEQAAISEHFVMQNWAFLFTHVN